MQTTISSGLNKVIIGDEQPVVLIGERINPTGNKKLAAALLSDDMNIVTQEAVSQVKNGADILDVNAGMADVDEIILLPRMVKEIMKSVNAPLCIDSNNPEALRAALKVYKGKPIINSVTGEERSLQTVLPLVKEYQTAIIGLTLDDDGIPMDSERRIAIAGRIINRAEGIGIPREDIILDCLAMPIGSDSQAGLVFLNTIHAVKAKFGVNLTLGNSNISFGLPDRNAINRIFLAIAMALGVTCPIVDVTKIRLAALIADLALGHDDFASRYINAYRASL
jgi:5-methyltetrahydrofolate--homocysteine methyltransferase